VISSEAGVPVQAMAKRGEGALYVFAAAMRKGSTRAAFEVRGAPAGASVEVIGERRRLSLRDGKFTDAFRDWDVHLYRIARE